MARRKIASGSPSSFMVPETDEGPIESSTFRKKLEALEFSESIAGRPSKPKDIRIDRLRGNKINPPHRVEKERKKTLELAEAIADAGGVLNPLHVFQENEGDFELLILCGHRRATAAGMVGESTVPCIIHTPSEIPEGMSFAKWSAKFIKTEGVSETWTAYDWLCAYVSSEKEILPSSGKTRGDILLCEEVFGFEGLQRLIDRNLSPHICRLAKTVRGQMISAMNENLVPSLHQISTWFLEQVGAVSLEYNVRTSQWPSAALRRWRVYILKGQPATFVDLTLTKKEKDEQLARVAERKEKAMAAKKI